MKRTDDFETRRVHLQDLTDAQLEQRFWDLIEEMIDPLLKLGYENTTPAIERSVLLRMGFSSLEAKALVDGCMEHNLMEHGAGNVVYRMAKKYRTDIRTAGLKLIETDAWTEAEALFGGENA